MRISTSMMLNRSLENVTSSYERLADTQEQIGTGKRINRPSDDPVGCETALNLQNYIDQVSQYNSNVTEAKNFMGLADNAMSSTGDLLRTARTLAVQGSTDTIDSTTRANLATQVQTIIDQVGSLGNASYGSRQLFSGQRTTDKPFTKNADSTYDYTGGTEANGDADLNIEIGKGDYMTINATGDKVFGSALSALKSLRDDLTNSQSEKISNNDISAIDSALNTVTGYRVQFGAQVQRLDDMASRYSTATDKYTSILSDVQDADVASTVVNLKSAELSYNASLKAVASGFQQSLLDFLG